MITKNIFYTESRKGNSEFEVRCNPVKDYEERSILPYLQHRHYAYYGIAYAVDKINYKCIQCSHIPSKFTILLAKLMEINIKTTALTVKYENKI